MDKKPSNDLHEVAAELKALQKRLEDHIKRLGEGGAQPWKKELAGRLSRYARGVKAASDGLTKEAGRIERGEHKPREPKESPTD